MRVKLQLSSVAFAMAVLVAWNYYLGNKSRNSHSVKIKGLKASVSSTASKKRPKMMKSVKVNDSKLTKSVKVKHSNQRPKLVLHVGPHKTGTTSIQNFLRRMTLRHFPQKDNFVYYRYELNPLVHCVIGKVKKSDCDDNKPPEIWNLLEKDSRKGRNVVISNEIFSNIVDTRGENWANFTSFIKSRFDVEVVVIYRRFYEWLPSFHQQMYKPTIHVKVTHWPDQGGTVTPTFEEYFTRIQKGISPFNDKNYISLGYIYDNVTSSFNHPTMIVKKRYEEKLPVKVIAMEGDMLKNFVCNQIPGATNTCSRAVTYVPGPNQSNKAYLNHYEILAVKAYQENMILNKTVEKMDVVEKVQRQQEIFLGLSVVDFPLKCLSPRQEDEIKNMSLLFEREIFPEPNSEREADHDEGFQKVSKAKKFCSIDADAVLKNQDWRDFFMSL